MLGISPSTKEWLIIDLKGSCQHSRVSPVQWDQFPGSNKKSEVILCLRLSKGRKEEVDTEQSGMRNGEIVVETERPMWSLWGNCRPWKKVQILQEENKSPFSFPSIITMELYPTPSHKHIDSTNFNNNISILSIFHDVLGSQWKASRKHGCSENRINVLQILF